MITTYERVHYVTPVQVCRFLGMTGTLALSTHSLIITPKGLQFTRDQMVIRVTDIASVEASPIAHLFRKGTWTPITLQMRDGSTVRLAAPEAIKLADAIKDVALLVRSGENANPIQAGAAMPPERVVVRA